jgi:hypothetical protein
MLCASNAAYSPGAGRISGAAEKHSTELSSFLPEEKPYTEKNVYYADENGIS